MDPGQFLKIVQGYKSAPVALKLIDANIRVNNITNPNSLITQLTWEGIRGPLPPVEPASAKKAEKPNKATGDRTIVRGGNSPTAIEEKRR